MLPVVAVRDAAAGRVALFAVCGVAAAALADRGATGVAGGGLGLPPPAPIVVHTPPPPLAVEEVGAAGAAWVVAPLLARSAYRLPATVPTGLPEAA